MKCIVIGGGIAGLTVTFMLKKIGFSVTLYEQASQLRPVGAGLGVGSNALQALYEAGLGKTVEELGHRLDVLDFYSEEGKLLNELNVKKMTEKYGVNNVTIHRADLHQTLLNALPKENIVLNKTCVAVVDRGDSVHVTFDDGSSDEGDYVLAADGIHSRIRKQLIPQSVPRYAGYTCWRGVVKGRNPYGEYTSTEIWGKGSRFGIVPLKEDLVYWFACVNAQRRDPTYLRYQVEDVAEHFSAYPKHVADMIRQTKRDELLHHDIEDIRPLTKFVYGRIILIGDAAHATTPNMGQGAGQAIEDAIVLAKSFSMLEPGAALQRYEKLRIKRTKKIITMSRRIGAGIQLENRTFIRVRNALFQRVPSFLLQKNFAFLLDVDF